MTTPFKPFTLLRSVKAAMVLSCGSGSGSGSGASIRWSMFNFFKLLSKHWDWHTIVLKISFYL